MSKQQPGMFEGRIGRGGFLLGFVYLMLLYLVPAFLQLIVRFIFTSAGTAPGSNPASTFVNIIALLVGLIGIIAMIPISISLYIRRLHDINQSGVLTLLVLVPLVNFIFLIYLLCAPGTSGANQYGPPAKNYNFWGILGLRKLLNR